MSWDQGPSQPDFYNLKKHMGGESQETVRYLRGLLHGDRRYCVVYVLTTHYSAWCTYSLLSTVCVLHTLLSALPTVNCNIHLDRSQCTNFSTVRSTPDKHWDLLKHPRRHHATYQKPAMSQIVRHLTLFILFTLIRPNFSKSISTSPVTYTVRSPVTSPASPSSSLTTSYPTETRLNGYATIVYSNLVYSGGELSWKNAYYATTYILNSCYRSYDNLYRLVYATSSEVVEMAFRDSQCAKAGNSMIVNYTEGGFGFGKVFIDSSVTRFSDIGGVTIRWVCMCNCA